VEPPDERWGIVKVVARALALCRTNWMQGWSLKSLQLCVMWHHCYNQSLCFLLNCVMGEHVNYQKIPPSYLKFSTQ
jgi:hypothetical protein